MIPPLKTTDSSDSELVTQSLAGNRDAFGWIVARYQSLLCSLAYSATGSLSQSEDLAQETFVTAWKQLADLREPEKLRSWLCRISRNLTFDALRRQGREPIHKAESLQEIQESPAAEPLPSDYTISREEEAILWRSIERIPESYREPLVLYYREHQSVENVAAALGLSEDAVKQRLSAGRKLLACMIGFCVAYGFLVIWAKEFIKDHHLVYSSLIIGLVLPFTLMILASGIFWLRAPRKFLMELGAKGVTVNPESPAWEYRSDF